MPAELHSLPPELLTDIYLFLDHAISLAATNRRLQDVYVKASALLLKRTGNVARQASCDEPSLSLLKLLARVYRDEGLWPYMRHINEFRECIVFHRDDMNYLSKDTILTRRNIIWTKGC